MNRVLRQRVKYWFVWVRTAIELYRVERRNPVLVYQMGKVGSSTVTKTLQGLGLSCPIVQVHILSPTNLHLALARQQQLGVRYLDKHLLVSRRLVHKLEREVFPCRIVTLTREPISRAISFVFQTLRTHAPDALLANGQIDRQKVAAKVVEVLQGEHPAADPGKWFDTELYEVFGIDVFSRPYDFQRGFMIFRRKDVAALVMRMEDLERHLQPALADFLRVDVPKDAIRHANMGERKWYASDIAWVKKNLRLAEETLMRVVGTKYFQHFYSPQRDEVVRQYIQPGQGELSGSK